VRNRVSIALATFNGEKYLTEQLHSFVEQTYKPDEVVIVDDCSVDSTIRIAHSFADTAPFKVLVYVNKINLGYAQNFSRALQLCSGDIVFISDQDDVWLPNKIERMISRFNAEPRLQLLIHDLEYCKADLMSIGQTKMDRMRDVFDINRDYVVGMATAIRGPFLKLCLPVPDMTGVTHDSWLHACATAVDKKCIMREILALYRRHKSNVTAAGILNVDFITDLDHFKDMTSNAHKSIWSKTILGYPDVSPLIKWLQLNKQLLVNEGYGEELRINALIDEELCRINRVNILTLKRARRLFPIFRFYKKGGYHFSGGWRGAMKDIFIN
jgi:glycosyltransferase involved in cell wall biosynthesis